MSPVSTAIGFKSPRTLARAAGLFYLVTFVGGSFAVMTRSAFIVAGDPSATALNILASEFMFRVVFAADIVAAVGYVGVTALLYVLLKPVNQSLSLLAAFFSLTGIAVGQANLVSQFESLTLLKSEHYATVFELEQLHSLTLGALELHTTGFLTALVFFGFYCACIGYLIIRSTFLPGLVGLLMVIAGLSYLIMTFSRFLALALPDAIAPFMMLPPVIGEGSLMLWLIFAGVNADEWRKLE